MLNFKTDDEIRQIKRYVIVYYLPLLSKLEIEQLKRDVPEFQPMITSKQLERQMSSYQKMRLHYSSDSD